VIVEGSGRRTADGNGERQSQSTIGGSGPLLDSAGWDSQRNRTASLLPQVPSSLAVDMNSTQSLLSGHQSDCASLGRGGVHSNPATPAKHDDTTFACSESKRSAAKKPGVPDAIDEGHDGGCSTNTSLGSKSGARDVRRPALGSMKSRDGSESERQILTNTVTVSCSFACEYARICACSRSLRR
jgi:hypothetical protein